MFQAKSEEQVETEKKWLDAEKLWLMHRGGFALARKYGQEQDTGKMIVQLEDSGDVLTVDEDDVEKVSYILNLFHMNLLNFVFSLLFFWLCILSNNSDYNDDESGKFYISPRFFWFVCSINNHDYHND